jgi:hypothetical protein
LILAPFTSQRARLLDVKRLVAGLLCLGLGAAVAALASRSPAAVETLYARGLYPALSAGLSCPASLLPLSLAEIVFLFLPFALAWRLGRLWQEGRGAGWVRAGLGLAADASLLAGALGLAFVLLWGLNYHRQPFAASAGLDASPARLDELRGLAASLAARADRLREGLPEDTSGVLRAEGGAAGVLGRVGAGFAAAAPRYPLLSGRCLRPKPALLSGAMSWLGLTGIYSPFTGEPNVNVAAPDVELPFSASHEAAHQRGFAREDEASFVGYLACRFHPDRDFNYAGALAASVHASNALQVADREAWSRIETARSEAVKRDLRALREWAARHEGPAARAAERVNDAYLRAQGQRDGVRSYGRMVDLLLAERRAERGGAE